MNVFAIRRRRSQLLLLAYLNLLRSNSDFVNNFPYILINGFKNKKQSYRDYYPYLFLFNKKRAGDEN